MASRAEDRDQTPWPDGATAGHPPREPAEVARPIGQAPRLGPFLIDRPRLRDRLDEPAPLTLLRAPVGFGKTSLIAQWAATREEVVAWLRVRSGGDARRFWADLLQVLRRAGLAVPDADPRSPTDDLARRTEEALLEAGSPVTLVADGFDRVVQPAVDEALLDILRHTPQLRLIIGLHGHRLFATEQHLDVETLELTARDLRFTEAETAQLLTAAGVEVTPGLAREVWTSSGGWPEPTRSLALSLRKFAFPTSADAHKLSETVTAAYLHLRLFPDADHRGAHELALRTSVADEFTAEVVEVLMHDPAAREHLGSLAEQGLLMVTTRGTRAHYRWSTAARTALRRELVRRDPDLVKELHRRLGRWHQRQGDPVPALRHSVASTDWAQAIAVIESSWCRLLFEHPDVLAQAFVSIPIEHVERSTRAWAVRDISMPTADDRLLTAAVLPRAPEALAEIGRGPDAIEAVDTCLAVVVAHRARGDVALARDHGLRALEIARAARGVHPARLGDLYPTLHLHVGIAQLLSGDLGGSLLSLHEAYEQSTPGTLGAVQSDAAAKLALGYGLLGEHTCARTWLTLHGQASSRAAPVGRSGWLFHATRNTAATARLLTALAELDLVRAHEANTTLSDPLRREEFWPLMVYARAQYALHAGTAEDALPLIDRVRAAHRGPAGRQAIADVLLAAAEADLHLSLGRGNLALRTITAVGETHPLLRVLRARLDLLTGHADRALQRTYDATWERVAGKHDLLAMQLIRAVAAHREGDADLAATTLARTVRAAADAGDWRPFLSVPGADLEELLRHDPGSRRLLGRSPVLRMPSIFPATVALISLTDREQQVLNELARDRTLSEIARGSVLSVNTVRAQRRSLYRKLGTSDRAEALARARELGLLSEG